MDRTQTETRTQEAGPQPVLPAILLVMAAVVVCSMSDVMAKTLRQSLPAVEIAWLRYIVFVAFALGVARHGGVVRLWAQRPGLQVLRGLAVFGSAILFITGLGFLPVAEATAISFVSPVFITALSVPFLGEVVGVRRWAAVLVGLAGVMIVIRPGSGALQAGALFPLLSALCWAVGLVITRRMGTADRAEVMVVWTAVTGLVVLTAAVPFGFVAPTLAQLGIGLALGICAAGGQYLVILAYRLAPASVLAPFSYVQLLSSTTLGFLVFGAVPDGMTLLGAAVIVASGLYTAHRERIRARERRAAPPVAVRATLRPAA